MPFQCPTKDLRGGNTLSSGVVYTNTFFENYKSAAAFLEMNWCVLLQGGDSSGKTLLAQELARHYISKMCDHDDEQKLSNSNDIQIYNNHNTTAVPNMTSLPGIMIKSINIDDTVDSKDLIGKFSATDSPGVFEWVAGSITSAIKNGTWILMENIDLASFDVLSMLLPLISEGKLFVADKGVTIEAHPDFRLIVTQTVNEINRTPSTSSAEAAILRTAGDPHSNTKDHSGGAAYASSVLKILMPKKAQHIPNAEVWPTIIVHAPTNDEKMLTVHRMFGDVVPESVLVKLLKNVSPRYTGLRYILKWARRVAFHIGGLSSSLISIGTNDINSSNIDGNGNRRARAEALAAAMHPGISQTNNNYFSDYNSLATPNSVFLSSRMCEILFAEAYDCFCASFPPCAEKNRLIFALAFCCEVSLEVAKTILEQTKPQIISTRDAFCIGRITLPLGGVKKIRPSTVAFAETKHSMCLMEQIACAIKMNESVLLTGETGVGKTFLVQYIADNLGQELIVHNLNQQTDSADFMGGWKPRDLSKPIRTLQLTFVELFGLTFNTARNAVFLNSISQAILNREWEVVIFQFEKGLQSARKKLFIPPVPTQNVSSLLSHVKIEDGKESGTITTFIENAEADETTGAIVPPAQNETPMDDVTRELFERWNAFEASMREIQEIILAAKRTFMFAFEEGTLVKAWREGYWILLDEINLATTEVLERVATILGSTDELVITEKGGAEVVKRHPNFRVFANMNPPTDVGKKNLPPSLRNRFTEFYVPDPFDEHDLTVVVSAYLSGLSADGKISEIVNFFMACIANARSTLSDLDGESKPPHFSLRSLTRALMYVRQATGLYGYCASIFDGLMMSFSSPLQRKFHPVIQNMINQYVFNGNPPAYAHLPKNPPNGAPGEKYIAQGHMWLELGPETPFKNEKFIMTPSVQQHLMNVARAVFTKRPVLLEGPTSAGKSSMIQYLAELTGHRFIRINNHETTEIQEYLGHYVSDENGKLSFVDGVLTKAVRCGHWVVLDELNLAPTEVLEALNRLLDDNCELFLPDTQEIIKPHPSLRIFATQNPSGIYGGRKTLSRAFRNRFLEIIVDDIPTPEIKEILCKRHDMAPPFAEKMVEMMTTLQRRRQSSHIFAGRHGFITPRDLFRWAERKARDYQTLAEQGYLILGERCRKVEEKQIVKDLIEKTLKVIINERDIYDPLRWEFTKKYFELVQGLSKDKIVWTPSMQRLFTVIGLCLEHQEPVLLVGETGGSKTTICQIWAAVLQQKLHIVNCHQHSEAADFLGSLRPTPPTEKDGGLFGWHDGPLVTAMKNGDVFVLDEISLAEDSVLERLNSVLEQSRSLTLAEKSTGETIVASEAFKFLATMNPGGDFGKKELSPALRNRFTEIYVNPITSEIEIGQIIQKRLPEPLWTYANKMAKILVNVAPLTNSRVMHISIRDVVGWADFMAVTSDRCQPDVAFWHGLDAVLLDGLSVGAGLSEASVVTTRDSYISAAKEAVPQTPSSCLQTPFWDSCKGIEEPQMPEGEQRSFDFKASTTRQNCSKILRACVLKKAIMLEGSPGVGKTSIVEALGRALGRRTVRVNLSEQTDMIDLLGAYLPTVNPAIVGDSRYENQEQSMGVKEQREATVAEGPHFEWRDGILLDALRAGHWIILDELNLASQSVLEGLNALLDHRATVYIPELCKEFPAHPDFRIFACQNPLNEGGGRKGLPKSFLNRFTKVRVKPFSYQDLCAIVINCTTIDSAIVEKMVQFTVALKKATMEERHFGSKGSPWEFNLRDILRWCNMWLACEGETLPHVFAPALFFQRFRSEEDRVKVVNLYNSVFGTHESFKKYVEFYVDNDGRLCADGHILTVLNNRTEQNQGTFCQASQQCQHIAEIVGTVSLSNGGYNALSAKKENKNEFSPMPLLLPSVTPLLESVIRCAVNNQFCLLVGPSCGGKSQLLEFAAKMLNFKLEVFSMTASCDTIDLLGGFDQVEGKQGFFEWRDSVIVRAMEEGKWVVLDNANFCSASVLDRLNSLVELNGVLVINEQGLVNGKVRVARAHPNFRLFATIDPKYGEISRALRNRAVEIYIPPLAIPSQDVLTLAAAESIKNNHNSSIKVSRDSYNQDNIEIVSESFNDNSSNNIVNTTSCSSPLVLSLISKMAQFHQIFTLKGMHADTSHPGESRLADAIASGAPTLSTLLRAINMAASNCGADASFSKVATASQIAFDAMVQCYMRNRSGSWVLGKEELYQVLTQLFFTEADGDENCANLCGLTVDMLMAAAMLLMKKVPAESGNMDLGSALDIRSAYRATLQMQIMLSKKIMIDIDRGNNISGDEITVPLEIATTASVGSLTQWEGTLFYYLLDSLAYSSSGRQFARLCVARWLGVSEKMRQNSHLFIDGNLFNDCIYKILGSNSNDQNGERCVLWGWKRSNREERIVLLNIATDGKKKNNDMIIWNNMQARIMSCLLYFDVTIGRSCRVMDLKDAKGMSPSLQFAFEELRTTLIDFARSLQNSSESHYCTPEEVFILFLLARPVYEYFNRQGCHAQSLLNVKQIQAPNNSHLDSLLPPLTALTLLHAFVSKRCSAGLAAKNIHDTLISFSVLNSPWTLLRTGVETAHDRLKSIINIVSDMAPPRALLHRGGQPHITSAAERELLSAAGALAEEYRASLPYGVRLLIPVWRQAAGRYELNILSAIAASLTFISDLNNDNNNTTRVISGMIDSFITAFVEHIPLLTDMEVTVMRATSASSFTRGNNNINNYNCLEDSRVSSAAISEMICRSARMCADGAAEAVVPAQWVNSACRAIHYVGTVNVGDFANVNSSNFMTLNYLKNTLENEILVPQKSATILKKWLIADICWMATVLGSHENIVAVQNEMKMVKSSFFSEFSTTKIIMNTVNSFVSVLLQSSAEPKLAQSKIILMEISQLLTMHDALDVIPTCFAGILLHILKCKLITPTSLIDPMLRQLVKKTLNENEANYWLDILHSFRDSDDVIYGLKEEESDGTKVVDALQSRALARAKEAQKKYSPRPDSTGQKFVELVTLEREILNGVLSDTRVASFRVYIKRIVMSGISGGAANVHKKLRTENGFSFAEITLSSSAVGGIRAMEVSEMESWVMLLKQYAVEIKNRFQGYEDFALPFVESLLKIAFFVEIVILLEGKDGNYSQHSTKTATLVSHTGLSPYESASFMEFPCPYNDTRSLAQLDIVNNFGDLIKLMDARLMETKLPSTALINFSQSLCSRSMTSFLPLSHSATGSCIADNVLQQQSHNNNKSILSTTFLFTLFGQLFAAVEERERAEVKAQDISVSYNSNLNASILIEEDDEKRKRKLKEMFPDYAQEYLSELDALTVEEIVEGNLREEEDEGAGALKTLKRNAEHQTEELINGLLSSANDNASADINDHQLMDVQKLGIKAKIIFSGNNGARLRELVQVHHEFYSRMGLLPTMASNNSNSQQQLSLLDSASTSSIIDENEVRLNAFEQRFDAVASIQRRGYFRSSVSDEYKLIGGFKAKIKLQENKIKGVRFSLVGAGISNKIKNAFNIYLDADPDEAKLIAKLLRDLLLRITSLRTSYLDNSTLQKIERISNRLLAYPALTTPLMRLICGSEVLLGQCYEWQRNASSEVSILNHINELSSCILRWRRLELHCWPHIFVAKQQEFASRASLTWFLVHHYCNDILADCVAGKVFDQGSCFAFVNDYMWRASIGEFPTRLSILEGFGYQLLHQSRLSTTKNERYAAGSAASLFLHTVGFFAQFSSFIEGEKEKIISPLKDDLKEFCNIMRWEDANYYAVRSTTQKSHLKIARILVQLDDGLSEGIIRVISTKESVIYEETSLGLPMPQLATKERNALKKKIAKEQKGKRASAMEKLDKKRSRDDATKKKNKKGNKNKKDDEEPMNTTYEDIASHYTKHWFNDTINEGTDYLEEISDDIVGRLIAMQLPKVTMAQKQRTFKLFMEGLAEVGVPQTHETRVPDWYILFGAIPESSNDGTELMPLVEATSLVQSQFPDLFKSIALLGNATLAEEVYVPSGNTSHNNNKNSNTGSHSETLNDEQEQENLNNKASTAFKQNLYKLVRYVSTMRDAERNPHQDLSIDQVRKGTGMAESLLRFVVDGNQAVTDLARLKAALRCVMAAVEGAAISDSTSEKEKITTLKQNESHQFQIMDEERETMIHLYNFSVPESLEVLRRVILVMTACTTLGKQALWYGCKTEAMEATVHHLIETAEVCLQMAQKYVILSTINCIRGDADQGEEGAAHEVCSLVNNVNTYFLSVKELSELQRKVLLCEEHLGLLFLEDNAVGKAAEIVLSDVKATLKFVDYVCRAASVCAIKDGDGVPSSSLWAQRLQTALDPLETQLNKHNKLSCEITVKTENNLTIINGHQDEQIDQNEVDETLSNPVVHDAMQTQYNFIASLTTNIIPVLLGAVNALSLPRTCSTSTARLTLITRIQRLFVLLDSAVFSVYRLTCAASRLCAVGSKLMTALLRKGFCKPEEEDDENGDGDAGDSEQKEGTGMDDGKGEKDVTDELENEDQLMNMKDTEEQERDPEGDKGDVDKKDKAADVETDFQAKKEKRSSDDEKDEDSSKEEDEESDKEFGDVDEDQNERKKAKKEKNDVEMSQDEGSDAEEVPEDEFKEEELEKQNGDEDENNNSEDEESKKDFDGKRLEESRREKDGKHSEDDEEVVELLADNDSNIDENSSDSEEDEVNGEEKDKKNKDDSGEEKSEGEDDMDPEKQQDEEASDHEPDHEEDADRDNSDDDDGEPNRDQKVEDEDDVNRECSEEGDDEDIPYVKDTNKQYSGEQDEETGEESTIQREEKEKKQQKDTEGAENEQQDGEEQEMDDAGRDWKNRQDKQEQSQRKTDDRQQQKSDSRQNNIKAIKEAMLRHNRRIRQLNLDNNVQIDHKKDDEDTHHKNEQDVNTDDENVSDKDNFEIHKQGTNEGMAPVDKTLTSMVKEEGGKEEDEMSDEEKEKEKKPFEIPQDKCMKRKQKNENNEEKKEELTASKDDKNKKRNKKRQPRKSDAVELQGGANEDESDGEPEKTVTDENSPFYDQMEAARKLWYEQESLVQGHAQQLCEQLRLILEPTLADKLQGDYKTGKRINIKKIIPYIASQFKKDRIWLRRTKPNKRSYQVLIALDDSLSMQVNNAGQISRQAVALLCQTLRQLEIGEFGVLCFGKETVIAHPLVEPFDAESGPKIFSEFTFKQKQTNMRHFLETTLNYMDNERERMSATIRSTTEQLKQILFIISDGQITEDRNELRKLLGRAEEHGQVVVLLILDMKGQKPVDSEEGTGGNAARILTNAQLKGLSAAEKMRQLKAARDARLKNAQNSQSSILEMQLVEFVNNRVVKKSYLEDFPFPYYIVVQDIPSLPSILADSMRQWFELINNAIM